MAATTRQSELRETASQLEAVLEKPVVPGELAAWTDAVSEACARVARALRSSVEDEHDRRYAEIERQDPGLLHRVAHATS